MKMFKFFLVIASLSFICIYIAGACMSATFYIAKWEPDVRKGLFPMWLVIILFSLVGRLIFNNEIKISTNKTQDEKE